MAALSDTERLHRLRLIRADNIGPITFHQLLRHFGTAAAAIDALPALHRRAGRTRSQRIPSLADATAEVERLAALGGQLLVIGDDDYPTALASIEDAPPVLHILGHPALLHGPAVAIVGSRNSSLNGRNLAQRLAAELGAAGFTIVSGLARGIDTAAHRGGLGTGTVAAVGGGVDVIYPAENQALYEKLVVDGAVIAELTVGTEPRGRHFPRRNRIISGLSLGVVVVEAARRSGSLITARLALEQGREVFAVPGPPLDPRCHGTNKLIRSGATLTECAQDVTDILSPMLRELPAPRKEASGAPVFAFELAEEDLDGLRARIVGYLSPHPVSVDEVIRQCDLPAAVVQRVLLEQELAGRLVRQPGGLVATISPPHF